ncbi:2OG-Fe dioxygenase family protein [Streptomyces misionensis]|uniref:2OG-Fe dioxygenase family protein n=1 Tax=Streptomyces misionensis TaxID=67331 RepID=UPI00367BC789
MTLNAQHYQIFDLPETGDDILKSFDDLAFDEYIGNGNRWRRFSQYRLQHKDGAWDFERLPHRPYVTYSKFNPIAGGIRRHYQPIEIDLTDHIREACAQIPLPEDDIWQINVHQYRVVASKELQGVVVPEGVHQDGHEFVVISVYNRVGITGAELTLRAAEDKETPIFTATLPAGQAIAFDDRALWHYVTDIVPVEEEGHRDITVVSFSRWSERWYGDDFEEDAIGEGRG